MSHLSDVAGQVSADCRSRAAHRSSAHVSRWTAPRSRQSVVLTEFLIVYRVHWLRALSLRDRAVEEATIVEHEMDWTVTEFKHRQMIWLMRAVSVTDEQVGHRAYALKQAALYEHFAQQANTAFLDAKRLYAVRINS